MINRTLKDKPMVLTSHRLQMLKHKKRIEQIPEDKRSEYEKRLLSDVSLEEHGILKGGDIQEMKRTVQEESKETTKDSGGTKNVKTKKKA